MLAKRHRQNHDFTILCNLVGDCHTPDAAYALLLDLREDRQASVDAHAVQALRNEAKELRARQQVESQDAAEQIEGRATLLEVEQHRRVGKVLLDAALAEIAFIDQCIAEVQPRRKYSHLSDAEATEACQEEEWCLELMRRAENHLLTSGSIPADQFETMRQHPAFASAILPRIVEIQARMVEIQALQSTQSGVKQLYASLSSCLRLLPVKESNK